METPRTPEYVAICVLCREAILPAPTHFVGRNPVHGLCLEMARDAWNNAEDEAFYSGPEHAA